MSTVCFVLIEQAVRRLDSLLDGEGRLQRVYEVLGLVTAQVCAPTIDPDGDALRELVDDLLRHSPSAGVPADREAAGDVDAPARVGLAGAAFGEVARRIMGGMRTPVSRPLP